MIGPILNAGMIYRMAVMGTILIAPSIGGCAVEARDDLSAEERGDPNPPVAIVRTKALQWEGEQTYIPLYADGTASGLIVVNFNGGLLYGTGTPDSWSWLDESTVEICGSVNILRNEVGFPPMERDCAPHPIMGKELDLDGDGSVDLVETFTILDSLSFTERRPD